MRAQVAAGEIVPVFFGSAITGVGVPELLAGCRGVAPGRATASTDAPSRRHGLQDRAPAIGREDRLRAPLRREAVPRAAARRDATVATRSASRNGSRSASPASIALHPVDPYPQTEASSGDIVGLHGLRAARIGDSVRHGRGSSPGFWLRLPGARPGKRRAPGRPGTDHAVTRRRSSTWRSKIRSSRSASATTRARYRSGSTARCRRKSLRTCCRGNSDSRRHSGRARRSASSDQSAAATASKSIGQDGNPFFATVGFRVEPAGARNGHSIRPRAGHDAARVLPGH